MPHVEPIRLVLTPQELMARWPPDRPLAALLSCETSQASHGRSRWSILAQPRSSRTVGADADPLDALSFDNPAGDFSAAPRGDGTPDDAPPFLGGWIGSLSYDLGRRLEPTASSVQRPPASQPAPPIALWTWCPDAYVHDNLTNRWWRVGDAARLPSLDLLRSLPGPLARQHPAYAIEGLRSTLGAAGYQRAVARCIEYILAGDVFQANIAHTIEGRFTGDPRALVLDLLRAARPWYGAFLHTEHGVIGSASPELFLHFDAASRRLVTRPMKGTRDAASHGSARDLVASPKDEAELTMIVDLMRNDLGRVCDFGTVRVDEARSIEYHGGADRPRLPSPAPTPDPIAATPSVLPGGVLQGVATVSGTLRQGLHLADALRATFPPGSVTGAPKVRAMQIIDELEPDRRGPYCGAIGYVSKSGDAQFSVAIRTLLIDPDPAASTPLRTVGRLSYSAGAGIVADSVPSNEWDETLIKAGVLLRTLGLSPDSLRKP